MIGKRDLITILLIFFLILLLASAAVFHSFLAKGAQAFYGPIAKQADVEKKIPEIKAAQPLLPVKQTLTPVKQSLPPVIKAEKKKIQTSPVKKLLPILPEKQKITQPPIQTPALPNLEPKTRKHSVLDEEETIEERPAFMEKTRKAVKPQKQPKSQSKKCSSGGGEERIPRSQRQRY